MDLYSEIILDYYKHPRNKTELPSATHQATEFNPTCGDKISIFLKIENNIITSATYQGEGCAISQASTSMLTEKLIGTTITEAQNLTSDDILTLLGVEISPGRIKCATIGLNALKTSLNTSN